MKFICNFCAAVMTPPHVFVAEQRFQCNTCGAKYVQQFVQQVTEDNE